MVTSSIRWCVAAQKEKKSLKPDFFYFVRLICIRIQWKAPETCVRSAKVVCSLFSFLLNRFLYWKGFWRCRVGSRHFKWISSVWFVGFIGKWAVLKENNVLLYSKNHFTKFHFNHSVIWFPYWNCKKWKKKIWVRKRPLDPIQLQKRFSSPVVPYEFESEQVCTHARQKKKLTLLFVI